MAIVLGDVLSTRCGLGDFAQVLDDSLRAEQENLVVSSELPIAAFREQQGRPTRITSGGWENIVLRRREGHTIVRSGGSAQESRDDVQEATDMLLLLYLLQKAHVIQCATKLQKLVFLCEAEQQKRQLQGFGYPFIKWDYGPFSKYLADDIDRSITSELVEVTPGNGYRLSARAQKLLSEFPHALEANREYLTVIDEVIQEYNALDLPELMAKVYALTIVPTGRKAAIRVGEARRHAALLHRSTTLRQFSIPNSEAATFNIYADKAFSEKLDELLSAPGTGRIVPYEEVFKSVRSRAPRTVR